MGGTEAGKEAKNETIPLLVRNKLGGNLVDTKKYCWDAKKATPKKKGGGENHGRKG